MKRAKFAVLVLALLAPIASKAQQAPVTKTTSNTWDITTAQWIQECNIYLPIASRMSEPLTSFTPAQIQATSLCLQEMRSDASLMSMYGDIPYMPNGYDLNSLVSSVIQYIGAHPSENNSNPNLPAFIGVRTALKALFPLTPAPAAQSRQPGNQGPANTVTPAAPPQG